MTMTMDDEREERTKKEQDSLIVVDRWEARRWWKRLDFTFQERSERRDWQREKGCLLPSFPFTMSRWKNETWGETVALKLSSSLFSLSFFFFLPTFSLLFHRKLHSLHLINDINGRCSPAVAIADCDMGCPALCIFSLFLSSHRICTFLSLHQFASAVSVWRRG